MYTTAQLEIKAVIDQLITAGTTFDIDQLDLLYHNDLHVLMINESDELMTASKEDFKALFQTKKNENAAPLDTWAEYHQITNQGDTAHVLLTRHVNLVGTPQKLVLSIDLSFEEDRWQVLREVIFAKPL